MIPDLVEKAVAESEENGRYKTVSELSGFSGDKLIGFLQRITMASADQVGHCTYLEVGVFRGLTLLSIAAASPRTTCFGIDNFSQFDRDGKNESFVRANIEKLSLENCKLVNADFEEALLRIEHYTSGAKIDVYFVDGPHDYRSQYLCLDFAKHQLSDHAIIIIDDSNYEHVRMASRDWLLANPEFKLAFQVYTRCHPQNAPPTEKQDMLKGWWNGVNVIVRDADGALESMLPPVSGSRDLYFNDHLIHPHRFASDVPAILAAFGTMMQSFGGMMRGFVWIFRRYLKFHRSPPRSDFPSMNTRSNGIVRGEIAAKRQV